MLCPVPWCLPNKDGSIARANLAMRGIAGIFSLCCGILMVYEISFVDHLFKQ